jgi:mono/diheme cytochrome c family protein
MGKIQTFAVLGCSAIWSCALWAQAPGGGRTGRQLPDGPGRDVTQRVCGATCHGPEIVMGTGRTREQWTAVVNQMVSKGAKATDVEMVQIANYLSTNLGPNMVVAAPKARPGAVGRGPGPLGAGAADSHVVDTKAADRGKTVYIAECITCHGNKARGGNGSLPPKQQGPDLVRSVVVLHDRYGSDIGPFIAKGHPMQSGKPGSSLTKQQVEDLAHFLHQRVYFTLRGGPDMHIQDVLTGDAKAGAEYFNGAGKCSTCHSPKGDLAGVGKKYNPPTLQSKFLFPRSVAFGRGGGGSTSKPVMVTVTQPGSEAVEGTLIHLDDFNVSLHDKEGDYHSFKITPETKVVKHDPYAAHVELLDQYTDKNIHDIVAYLETLK